MAATVPVDSALVTGRLLLPTEPSGMAGMPVDPPFLEPLLALLSILLFLLLIKNFRNIIPYLLDNFTRARGSVALESSVRVSRDRNLIALIFVIPYVMTVNRYGLYEPDWLQGMDEDLHLFIVAGVLLTYLILRRVIWWALRPKRGGDNYMMARRSAYTFFILISLIVLPTVGLLGIFHANTLTVKTVVLVEIALVYAVYLVRKAQILSLSCGPLTVFLYLCALEIFPTGLLVASAMFL